LSERNAPRSWFGCGQLDFKSGDEIAKEANLVYAVSRAWKKGQSAAPLAGQAFRCRSNNQDRGAGDERPSQYRYLFTLGPEKTDLQRRA